jgi:hypothetical protein
VDPQPGQWTLVLEWANPVSGSELAERFNGKVAFDQLSVATKNVPDTSTASLSQGHSHTLDVKISNNGVTPEGYFLDPRLDKTITKPLANLNTSVLAQNFSLPLAAGLTDPFYLVPTGTTQLTATINRLSGSADVSFDFSYLTGDPDFAPGQAAAEVASTYSGTSASLTLAEPDVIGQGIWSVDPAEVGPFSAKGAPLDTAAVKVTAVTQAFDNTVSTGTDDFWTKGFKFGRFVFLEPGESLTIPVTIKPTAAVGTRVSGTLYVDDFTLAAFFAGFETVLPDADQVAAVPYSYTVAAP